LRIKGCLIVRRNQTRDFLDVTALSDRGGQGRAAAVLADMDRYYADQHEGPDGVASQLARQLSDPRPADTRVTGEFADYKGLRERWHDWRETMHVCRDLADRMLERALTISRPYGLAGLMERAIQRSRERAYGEEREEIARQVRRHVDRSGLTRSEFAQRIGTSPSRLLTYLSGKVTPSAAMLLRMSRVNGAGR